VSNLKPSPGFATIEQEFEERTAKAFHQGADYVIIRSRHQQFQAEAVDYCISKGWLTCGELIQLDEQSSEIRCRLTSKGKEHWGITK